MTQQTTGSQSIHLNSGLYKTLGLQVVEEGLAHVVMSMPIDENVIQPFGYLHGGATISLLESAASWGASFRADCEKERAFGTEAHIYHVRSATEGKVRGEATLATEEDRGYRGRKQVWNVVATDDAGNVLSQGTFITKVVSLERLAQKQREDGDAASGIGSSEHAAGGTS